MKMLKDKRRLQAIYSLFNKAPFWLDCVILLIAIALIVYLEILVQDNNTLLPICIPWMYDRFAMCVISILLAFIKKISGKSKEKFGSIFGGYCIKTALCFILMPALILLPNKYLPSTILVKEKYGVVIDLASIKINKSTSSRKNYVKIKLDNEDISFWYDTYKETKPLGTKCIMNIKRGFFGLRYADNVDFLVE